MNRMWLGLAAIAAAVVLVVAGVLVWQRRSAPPAPGSAEAVPIAEVRPSDTGAAIEIPQSPYRVIPNELVVLLKEGATVEAFAKSLPVGGPVKVVGAVPSFRLVQVEVPAAEREARKAELESNPLVRAVTYQSVFTNRALPNDPVFTNADPADDWNLRAINAGAAWDLTTGSADVVIAVVDGGVLLDHEELRGKIVRPASIFSKDGSQVGDRTVEGLGHGTHVAVTAAGAAGNGAGTSGVCPGCRIMPVQVARRGLSSLTAVAAGIEYAVRNGARVVNLSMGPDFSGRVNPERFGDAAERSSIKSSLLVTLRKSRGDLGDIFMFAELGGTTVVVAAGNDNLPGDFNVYCASPLTLCVGNARLAEAGALRPAPSSNYGFMVDVSAPGTQIYSATAEPGGKGYASFTGTSMASPHVAGLAGLILSANPRLKPWQVRAAIIAGSFAGNAGGGRAARWFADTRGAVRDLDHWRRALLRLTGKDERKQLPAPIGLILTLTVPPDQNTVWDWPYVTTRGKGDGDKVIGGFVDARRALDLAASGAFGEAFAAFTEAELEKILSVPAEALVRLHDMLWFEGRFAGSPAVGGAFTLEARAPFERLTVARAADPGRGYEEWLEYRAPSLYRHHARFDGKNYGQGPVRLRIDDGRLVVTNPRRKDEVVYVPE